MLSPFLKKLLFVRKFFIIDGQIEILGEKQMMLPFSVVDNLKSEETFSIVNKEVKKVMASYAKKIGASSGGMIKSAQDIYETMGLGKMKIIKLDADKKNIILRIEKVKINNMDILSGVLSGLFSFVFDKEITEKDIKVAKKTGYVDISII